VIAADAQAQMIAYAGYTNGAFDNLAPNTSGFQSSVLGGLTYENSTFSGNTLGGSASIGNAVNPLGSQDVDNLGAFYLTAMPFTYGGHTFSLRVSFTLPGSANFVYWADLTGQVSANAGGVFIDFDNSPQVMPYTSGDATGMLSLAVNDVDINSPMAGQTHAIALSGRLTATQAVVPEPATVGLMATGLVAMLGFGARRRRTA
jgi:hypothetical protein